jgi:DHA1 family multidrug resistance protein-like MFS transporter
MASLGYGIVNQSAIPPYVREIGLVAQIGIIWAAFLVAETAFKSPLGSLGDRIGRRPLIVGGALLSGLSALGMTRATGLGPILALRAVDGLAAAAIWPTVTAALGGCVGPRRRTTAMSVMLVTYIAGLAVGPFLGGIANDSTGSRLTSFYLAGVLFLSAAVVSFFLIPTRVREEEGVHERGPGLRIGHLLLGLKGVPDMMLLAFTAFFGIGLLVPIVKLFAMDEFGMSETAYGGVVLPVALGVAAAALVSGRLGDRWGKARSVRLGITISALAMWMILPARHPWQLAVAGMFLGIGFVVAMPAWLALVADMASPWTRGAVIGALGTAQGIGAILGAALGAYLYKLVGVQLWGIEVRSHYSPFVLSAVMLSVCLGLAILFVKEGECRRMVTSKADAT